MPSTRAATSTRTEWFVGAVAWDDPRARALRGISFSQCFETPIPA